MRIGVLDGGFNGDGILDHPAAVAAALQEIIAPEDAELGSHGAIVSRVIGGRDIGDGFPQGLAYGFSLYQANAGAIVTEAMLSNRLGAFAARNVRIVNNSWSLPSDPAFLLPDGDQTRPDSLMVTTLFPPLRTAVLTNGMLLIWAAGNETQDNPYLMAGAPAVDPTLERGWLAVVQLQADNTLSPWSNACGVAANWCLGAQAPNNLRGTSFAAPVVTAVAGLVSQAYPWMDNSALRQTILSTADDLGNRALYGWGRVNPERAVRGPALFDTGLTLGGNFVANFDAVQSTFYNDIAGNAGLDKLGTGTLILTGSNTYAGATNVLGGTLGLSGSLASDVNVGAAGTLLAKGGVVNASVNNGGRTEARGTGLHITGDYTAQDTSTTAVQLGSIITVGRTATLAGSTLQVLKPEGRYVVRSRETVLRAGRLEGTFSRVTAENGLLYVVSARYSATQVELDTQRRNVAHAAQDFFGADATRQSAGHAVETAFRAADAKVQGAASSASDAFVAAAAKLQSVASRTALGNTLDSVSGQIFASSQALAFQQSQTVDRALTHRLDSLASAMAAPGAWLNLTGAAGTLAQSGFARADTRLFAAQAGADQRVGPSTVLGGAFTWSDANARFDRHGGGATSRGQGVSLYGRQGDDTGPYLAGRVGYDWLRADVRREILAGDARRVASARQDRMASAYAELGYTFADDDDRLTPFVGVSYDRLQRGRLDESAHAFGLKAAAATHAQAGAASGMRFRWKPGSWAGRDTVFSAYAAYRYANAERLDFTAAFTGAPDATFRVQGIGLRRHSGWAGVGAASGLDERLSWFVHYDVQASAGGVANHVLSARMRYRYD
ncbi:autotransporter domain-containing protein [Bordetella genomosp. 5]|uniref:autotransporter domain-containing protein n=1 Tax=Bordetella genomosp. 5 TaxID=1395608 RepID=UPI00201616C8|nr:autotransporter serine protease [Bordetella genomosp. 5]